MNLNSKKNYFQFKQFGLYQGGNGLKFGTDASILGASMNLDSSVKTVLDIGAGTGVLALMLAQKSDAQIDGLELDAEAYAITKENFANSPWQNRLRAIHQDLQSFQHEPYDFILSNPPYFENDLPSQKPSINLAKHQQSLNLRDFVVHTARLSHQLTKIAVILPCESMKQLVIGYLKYNFFPCDELEICSFNDSEPIRTLMIFSQQKNGFEKEKLAVYEQKNVKSNAMKKLLEPYLLS